MARTNLHRALVSVLLTLMVAGLAASTVGASDPNELRFRVLLNDNEIGYHSFRVMDDGSEQVIESEASFDVKLFFVPVYSYRHSNTEVWRNGCLSTIESRTDDNGKEFEVRGIPNGETIQIATQDDTDVLSGCVMTFAYWNPDFLAQSRLLNAQNGEYMPVQIEAIGQDVLRMGDRRIFADAYRILAPEKKVDITVWYDQDTRRWLALESVAKNGQLVRYLPDHVDDMVIATRETPTDS